MTKLMGGPGWALIPADAPPSPKTNNPKTPKPTIRLEKRNGKQVTVISGLHTYGKDRLNEIAKILKIRCGSGGTVKNGIIEIQGDKVTETRSWFQ